MSSFSSTRLQCVYLEVRGKSGSNHVVTLFGPTDVIQSINANIKGDRTKFLETSMMIIKFGVDLNFMKAMFAEEVLKWGFVYSDTSSSIKDDFIVFSRQVRM